MLDKIEAALDDIRAGKLVIVVDDEDRENEGDLVIPAQFCDAQAVNFMAKHGRGLICLALMRKRCEELGLPLMAQGNEPRISTAFTVSIEAREGVTTGISAGDRARTIAHVLAWTRGQKPDKLDQRAHVVGLAADRCLVVLNRLQRLPLLLEQHPQMSVRQRILRGDLDRLPQVLHGPLILPAIGEDRREVGL